MSRERRKVLAALLCAALAVPRSFAQVRVRRIAFLLENDYSFYGRHFDAFRAGMRELGYALAARTASRDVPILIVNAGDPVASGLAQSLRRPGGNVTGLTSNSVELYGKRLDLLRHAGPSRLQRKHEHEPSPGHRRGGREWSAACRLSERRQRGGRRIGVVCRGLPRPVSARRRVRRPDLQGCQAGRAAHRAAHANGADRECAHGEGAGYRDSASVLVRADEVID